ncbi:uncharacterized protein LOC118459171 [Anopheles albimanus]|uniref:Uncharacterized protein n=1 Tax=Anopheles albimanus TaxID=7167 RepID=A0A182FXA1_ANOAL|nr:uncharacterized protein LOC118459171 [Anopheles albimanus]
MMRSSGIRLLVTVLVSLIAVQSVTAFTDAFDDIWSLLFDSSSSESNSMEMINVHTKNATIKVDCTVPCTLNVVCNNCNTMMTSNMQPNDPAPTTVANGGAGTVPSIGSVATDAPAGASTTLLTTTDATTTTAGN